MNIRLVEKEEFTQVIQLRDYSFSSEYTGEKLKDFEYWLENSKTLGSFKGDKLVGQVVILPLNITVRRQPFNMGGIGFVATYPEYRNQGIMKQLLIQTLKQMKQDGQVLSVLAPFSVSFYRYFGWEIFNDVLSFDIPLEKFPRLGNKKDVVRRMTFKNIDEELFAEISDFHNNLAETTNGMMARNKAWWNRIIRRQPLGNLAAIYLDEKIAGYLRYEVIGMDFNIVDFYVTNYEAEQGLWRFIVAHEASVNRIIGEKSSDTYFGLSFAEPQFKREILQQTMLRIVDVEGFFTLYTFKGDFDFYLEIEDQFASWNTGVFYLSKVGITKLEDSTEIPQEKKLCISINWLTALVAGYVSIEELKYMNLVEVSNELLFILSEVFPKERNFFHEYF